MDTMTKLAKKVGAVGVTVITSVLMTKLALADGVTLCDPLGTNCQYGGESFQSIATSVAGFIFWDIASPLAVIMVLVGAFQLITSSGSPEKVSKGRKTILWAAIGFLLAILAGGIVNIIQNFVQQAAATQ
jgi:Type IV secretion system pilin